MIEVAEDGVFDPYKHMVVKEHLIGGIYTKECHLPVGFTFGQHRHTFAHQSVLASGRAIVEVDGVKTEYTGPAILTIEARKIHEVTPITPCVWLCQHVTNCTGLEDIDIEFIHDRKTEGS
jgi:hypothetical protein